MLNSSESAATTSSDFIQTIAEQDLRLVEEMYAREGDKYKNNTAENFSWWYFRNPSQSTSLFGVNLDGAIEGFASTNNFWFQVEGQKKLVAMIQKVITLPGIRGKGYFGKLLKELEKDNLNNKHADILVGFPNGNAAPIYINKFSYKWAEQLEVKYTPAAPSFGGKIERLSSTREIHDFKGIQLDNAVLKDSDYVNWRYEGYPKGFIHVLKISRGNKVAGYAILRTFHKKKVPFYLLMDLIVYDRSDVSFIFRKLKGYALKNKHAGLLFVGTELFDGLKGMLVFDTPKKIDYMVKGKNDAETDHLKTLRYNLYFGDMDFF